MLNPAATKASRMEKDVASSAVHPNTLPPSTRGAISNPDFPSGRRFTAHPPSPPIGGGGGCGGLSVDGRQFAPRLAGRLRAKRLKERNASVILTRRRDLGRRPTLAATVEGQFKHHAARIVDEELPVARIGHQ